MSLITRKEVLERIRKNLDMAHQWKRHDNGIRTGFLENTIKYTHQAEGLIELLEVHDCGSVGGFCDGHTGHGDLEMRYSWLLEHPDVEVTSH